MTLKEFDKRQLQSDYIKEIQLWKSLVIQSKPKLAA